MTETGTNAGKKVFLFSPYYILIALFSLMVGMGLQIFNSTTALYVSALGGSAEDAGLMLSCFTIAATLMRLAGGALDKIGRRKIIVVGALIFAAAAYAYNLGVVKYLYAIRFVQGIGYSLATTGIGVAITDVIPQPRMGEGIGYYGLSQTLTMAVGPTLALALCRQGQGPFGNVFLAATIMLVATAVGMVFCRYEKDAAFQAKKSLAEAGYVPPARIDPSGDARPQKGFWAVFEKSAAPVAVPTFALALTSAATVAFLTLYATGAGIENIGLYFLLNALATVTARLSLGRLADRVSVTSMVLPGFAIVAAGFICLILSARIPLLFALAGLLGGFGNGMISPTLNAEVIRRAPNTRRGAATATYLVVIDIGIGAGAYLWGLVLDFAGSFTTLFACCVGCCVAGALATVLLLTPRRRQAPEA